MRDVADYRRDMLSILGDAGGRRYSEVMLDMGLREALAEYAGFFPRRVCVTGTVDHTEGDMAVVPWLFGDDAAVDSVRVDGEYRDHAEFAEGGKLYVKLDPLPGAGSVLTFGVTQRHSVRGLDGAAGTSVPDGHALMVSTGAAGYAMRMRARSVTEVFGKRPEDREALSSQANRLITDYIKELKWAARQKALRRYPW